MSDHANRGKPLEDALRAGCAHYKGLRRGNIRKREPNKIWQDGAPIHISKGDVDFSGDAEGRAFYAEAKSTLKDALPLSELEQRPHQIKKLRDTAASGCMSGVIIGFMPEFSVWWIPFVELAPFLDAPWRRSISRNMCAAWGLLLPMGASPAGRPMVKFLDGAPFTGKDAAITAVNADRLANPLELSLDLDEPDRPSRRVAKKRNPFDLLDIAKWAKRKGIKGKKWSER